MIKITNNSNCKNCCRPCKIDCFNPDNDDYCLNFMDDEDARRIEEE